MKQGVGFCIALFLTSTFYACGGGGGGGGGSGTPQDSAFVRVVHLSPDAPAVDVLVDDEYVLEGATYPSASEYLPVAGAVRNIKVNASGSRASVIDADLELRDGTIYTVAAINRLNAIEPLVLIDQTHASNGNAAVRVVHGAPSAPAVDVYATAPDGDLATATPVLANVPFKTASDYLSVPPGDYRFRVTIAGTKTVAIDSGTVHLDADETVTAFARDNTGGGQPFGILLVRDGQL